MIYAVAILSVLLLVAIFVICYLLATRPSRQTLAREEERFRMMARDIFAENSRQMRDDNERSLGQAIAPLRESFNAFGKAFADSYSQEMRERNSLKGHIDSLVRLNSTISAETRRLTQALKSDTREQGRWGEMLLATILQRSGLRQGEEYLLQSTITTGAGERLRPDAVFLFPDGRKIAIDSKVSLTAYLRISSAESPEQRVRAEKEHVDSVKRHVNELKTKRYQDHLGPQSADFTLMFIPNDGAYITAMDADDTLWQYAYDGGVIIASPTHLLSTLKLVEQAWRVERQELNAQRIAQEGGKLVDKLVAFLDDMRRVDNALASAKNNYDCAMGKLTNSQGAIAHARRLNELGAKSSKKLPDIYPNLNETNEQ